MNLSFLLLVIILTCVISLAFLLFPKETSRRMERFPKKKPKPASKRSTAPSATTHAKKTMPEKEAVQAAVQNFAREDPGAAAKIIKSKVEKFI